MKQIRLRRVFLFSVRGPFGRTRMTSLTPAAVEAATAATNKIEMDLSFTLAC
jgi:hypothetical protein